MTTYSKYKAGQSEEKDKPEVKKVSVFEIQCFVACIAVLGLLALKSLDVELFAKVNSALTPSAPASASEVGAIGGLAGQYAQYLLSQYRAESASEPSTSEPVESQSSSDVEDIASLLGLTDLSLSSPKAVMTEYSLKSEADVNVGGDLVPVALMTDTTKEKTDSFAEKAEGGLLSAPEGCSFDAYFPDVRLNAPVSGKITSEFGYRYHPITGLFGFHTGVDIAAAKGTSIYASAAGKVAERGYSDVWGNYLVIRHSDSVSTFYAHCSTLYKKNGASVKAGEKIAAVGSTGWSTGPHLHFEVRIDGINMNPAWILK